MEGHDFSSEPGRCFGSSHFFKNFGGFPGLAGASKMPSATQNLEGLTSTQRWDRHRHALGLWFIRKLTTLLLKTRKPWSELQPPQDIKTTTNNHYVSTKQPDKLLTFTTMVAKTLSPTMATKIRESAQLNTSWTSKQQCMGQQECPRTPKHQSQPAKRQGVPWALGGWRYFWTPHELGWVSQGAGGFFEKCFWLLGGFTVVFGFQNVIDVVFWVLFDSLIWFLIDVSCDGVALKGTL